MFTFTYYPLAPDASPFNFNTMTNIKLIRNTFSEVPLHDIT